ncbi:hypothetical protein FSP39_010266 [Pinctada imbricata]|uniref:Receptor ligand binding region domain-containing protein n=1 Tax=Pinctada imbricata TaxID=66713 RepID=A0AA88YQN3_PINIB|nr:hypothetical protein FSP39_010266 [Pinctada imbricata]
MLLFALFISADTRNITVVWMAPKYMPPSTVIFVNASTSVGAMSLAIQRVYDEGILNIGQLSVYWLDDGCDSKQSIGKFTDFLFNNIPDVIFGPPCTKAMIPIAELASYRNIPVFGWISNEETLDNKTKLDTLSRLIPPITELGGIFSYFILIFNWLRFVIISSEDAECNAYANAFISTFESTTFSFTIAHHYARVDVNVTEDKIDDMLNAIKYEGRIVILIVPESELRTYMVRAAVLGMAEGDYQFLFVKTVIPTPQDKVKLATTQLWWRGDGLDSYARRACESLLFIVFADYFEDTSSWEATSRAATETLLGNNTNMPPWAEPDIYSPFLHDAVYMYAKALNQSGGDPDAVNGTSIAEAAARITFKGLSGDVVMSYLHDRYPDITVYDMTAHGNFTIVAYLRFVIENSYIDIKSNVTTIRWGNGQTSADFTPKDTPACGFYNENCPVKTSKYNSAFVKETK